MPAAKTTRLTIKQDVVRALAPRDEAIANLPVPLASTAAGSTTTIVDTKLGRGTTQANRYDGRNLEIMSTLAAVAISSNSEADPTVVTTAAAHGFAEGDKGQRVNISGNVGSVPDINGDHTVIQTGASTFSIPIVVTTAGTGGTVTELSDYVAVDDGGFNGTSTLTYSPAVAVLPPLPNPYIAYPLGLAGDRLDEIIAEVLRDTMGPYIHFPTAVPDGDLSGSPLGTVGDWWTKIGDTMKTLEYATTSTNQWITQQIFGERSLHCVEEATSTGVKSDIFYVSDTRNFVASFFVQALVGTLTVLVYDETNGATIGTAVSVDEPGWKEIRFTEAVPAGCESVSVRFAGSTEDDEYYISAPIIFQSTSGTRNYAMPSWFTNESQFRQALFLPLGVSSEDTGSYVALSAALKAVVGNVPQFLDEARGVNPLKAILEATSNGPVAFLVQRAFDELDVNASTTNADREYMRSKVIATILRDWGDAAFSRWARRASNLAKKLDYDLEETRIVPNPVRAV